MQYQVAYTFSRCRTDNSGYYGNWGAQASPANPYYQNLYDPKADWADCFFDAKNVLSAYAIYDIPFGRGKRFGHDVNRAVDAIAGGWSIAPIVSIHSGFPLALYDFGTDSTGTNSRDYVRIAELVRDEPSDGKFRWIRPVSTSATSGSIPRLTPLQRWERSATVRLKVQFADQDTEMWI